MPTYFTGPLIPSQPFKITLPATATVNAAGEVVADLSGDIDGAIVATTITASGAVDFASTLNVDGATTLHGATVATGNLAVSAGSLSASTTVTGGTGLTATTGNVLASTGNITATLGSVTAGTTITAGTGLTVTSGTVNLSGATLTLPTGKEVATKYTSQVITQADLTPGASCTVALTGEPTADQPVAVYMFTNLATTSNDGNTTGLTCKLGIVGVDDGYLADSNVFGAAGVKEAFAGTLIGSYRAADPLIATFTATGAVPDCADIDQLSIQFVVKYFTT